MFFVVSLVLLAVPTAYLGLRLVRHAEVRGVMRLVAWGLLVALPLLALLEPLRWTLGIGARSTFGGVAALSYGALGLFSALLTFVVIRDVLWGSTGLALRLFSPSSRVLPRDPERRAFLTRALNAGVVGGSGLFYAGGSRAAEALRVVEVEVPVPHLPDDLVGFCIAQITDLHIGPQIGAAEVKEVVRLTNQARPDLVAITGDLVDGTVDDLFPDVELLGALRPRLGTYFVTGNHEYYSGAAPWIEALRGLGMTVLENAHVVHQAGNAQLVVAGVNDLQAARFDPEARTDIQGALKDAPEGDHVVRVLLAHQPRTARHIGDTRVHVQLSGHTHGGQFFPWNIAIHLFEPWVAGLYSVGEQLTKLYVSRGTGYWGPKLRLGSPSEITLLTLMRARGD